MRKKRTMRRLPGVVTGYKEAERVWEDEGVEKIRRRVWEMGPERVSVLRTRRTGGQREVTWGWEEAERVRADESGEGSLRWSMGRMRGE